MSTSVDTMKNFFNVLKLYANDTTTNGIAILDHAIRTTTRFAGLQDAVNHFVADMASVTSTQGAAQSLLQNCGIIIGEEHDFTADTGAVSGWNAGMGVIKDAQTIVPEPAVLLSQLPLPAAGSQTVHSYTGADGNTFFFTITYPETYLTVRDNSTAPLDKDGQPDSSLAQSTTLQAGETYITKPNEQGDYDSASAEQIAAAIQTMMRGVESYWASESFKLAYDSFGLEFNNKNLAIEFGINQGSQAETGPAATDPGHEVNIPANNIEMELNSVMYAGIDPNDVNGNTRVAGGSEQNYLDRTIAHELIHAVMQASGTLKETMPEFFTEGVAELVHGDDDFDSNLSDEVVALAQDSTRLTQALVFKAGTGTHDAYPAGDMFLRYICRQSLPTQVAIGNGFAPQNFNYAGGEEILSGAATGSQINAANGVQLLGANIAGDDLFVAANNGTLIIRDARGKVLNFAGADGNVAARFYAANEAGTIDGRNLSGYEMIQGAAFANNDLYAGNGGSQLWGGAYGNDNLVGGASFDEFIAGVGCGSDTVFNAGTEDLINLASTTLSQISSVSIVGNGVESNMMMNFTDGSSLNIRSNSAEIVNVKLGDGSAYSHINATGTWIKTN